MPNQRVLIIEYLLDKKHYKKYDSYIFGSSRVGYLNPNRIKDFNTYNMTYSEGIPHEHLLVIKFFLKHHFPIKHLLIGLDEFSYQVPFSRHDNQFGAKSHYLVTNTSLYDFYKFFFFRKATKYDKEHFLNKFIRYATVRQSEKIYDVIHNQKTFYMNIKEKNNHNQKYINNEKFTKPTPYVGNELEDTINDIKEIVKLAKENNIELHMYINPIHHTTYDFTNKTLLKKFREKLSHITSYYDFSHPSYISKDNGYWDDTSHFNMEVGRMILSKIYDKNSTIKNFGVFVKKVD
jgi:hypothetical protein